MREIRGGVFQGRFHNLLISKNNTFWAPQISRITFQVVSRPQKAQHECAGSASSARRWRGGAVSYTHLLPAMPERQQRAAQQEQGPPFTRVSHGAALLSGRSSTSTAVPRAPLTRLDRPRQTLARSVSCASHSLLLSAGG